MKKRRVLFLVLGLLLAVGLLFADASRDRCGEWPAREPAVTHLARGQGQLLVGAGKVDFALPFPVPAGGYGPLRPAVDSASTPLSARALVFDVGGQRLGLVVLDVLLVSPQLRDAVAKSQPFPVWVLATHTHSGPGAYSPSAAAEYAALGTYVPAVEAALVTAARDAVSSALEHLAVARYELGTTQTDGVSAPRSGKDADQRLTRLRFDGEAGPVGQLLIVSAHPAVVPKKPDALHADWPGLLAMRLEREGGPVTLVLQGAAGNASVNRALLPTPEAVAEKLETLVRALPTRAQAVELHAAWSEVQVSLPRPDVRNVVPAPFRGVVENAVCDDAEDVAVLHALKLGDARLLFVPLEPSFEAGLLLEQQAEATRLVSLADGYAGYVETEAHARSGDGEARRQYFPPELLSRLAEGARLVGETTK